MGVTLTNDDSAVVFSTGETIEGEIVNITRK